MSNFVIQDSELQSVSKHIEIGKAAIWNANKLNGSNIGNLDDAKSGDVLLWDETLAIWKAGTGGGGGGVTNPLTSDLKLGGFGIVEELASGSPTLNIEQENPAKEIKLSVGSRALRLQQNAFNGIKLTELDSSRQIQIGTFNGVSDSNLRTLSTSTQFDKTIEMNANINDNSGGSNTIGDGVLFWGDVRSKKLTGDGLYEKTGGSQSLALNANNTQSLKELNMNSNDITNANNLWVNNINGLTPYGGVFSGTSPSRLNKPSTGGAIEVSLLPTSFVGSVSVPANTFQISSYHLVLAGSFGANNGDTLTLRLKAGATSTIILATLVVPLSNASGSFECEVDFQLRNVGGAGVADICSNFDFTYNKSNAGGAFVGERGVFQNNTTFDTTTLNILEITGQFSSINASNSIQSEVQRLTRTY